MSTPNLTPTSYLVLGLVAGMGPVNPYEMKQMVNTSIGYFWSFPHSQLYAEPDRLTDAGLLQIEQEAGGRRRKRYTITEAGMAALRQWLADPVSGGTETREPGLLKLFFGAFAGPGDLEALANAKIEQCKESLGAYRAIEKAIAADPDFAYPALTLRLGIKTTEASLEFWEELLEELPRLRSKE